MVVKQLLFPIFQSSIIPILQYFFSVDSVTSVAEFLGLLPIEWVEKDSKALRPGGASRTWRDSISGNSPDSGAVAWVPQGSGPRSPCGKPNPCFDPANKIRIRREPMKEQLLYDVPPGAGCAPGAPPGSSPPWQWAYRPMENRPKLPTRLGEDPNNF